MHKEEYISKRSSQVAYYYKSCISKIKHLASYSAIGTN